MTRDEVKARLKELAQDSDTEVAHRLADEVLCRFLEHLGEHEVVELYNEVDKWYG